MLFQKQPQIKGAIIGEPGNRVWVVWMHRFYEPPSKTASRNTLYILRLVMENQAALSNLSPEPPIPDPSSESSTAEQQYNLQVERPQAVISAAQAEAAGWAYIP
jgi:hypothetical protein